MIINRVIDNAAVAAASLTRAPVSAARQQALDHAVSIGGRGATVFGVRAGPARPAPSGRRGPTASPVRELDYHDTFLAAEYSHPATTSRRSSPSRSTSAPTGARSCAGIATGYEIQIDLVRAISLHKHKIDHVAHLGPSAARRHRHAAGPRRRDHLPGRRPGAAHHHRHAAVAQGRDLHVEGARPRVRRQDGRRGGRPGDARPDLARPRSTRARTASSRGCSTARGLLRRAAARRRRGQARHPRLATRRSTRPSTRRRPGSTSPASCTASTPSFATRANVAAIVLHTCAPHALRDRLGRERPAEVRPDGIPRDARPLDPVHLHGRAAGRRLAPRRLVRPGARRPRRHGRPVAARSPPPRTRSGRAATTRRTRTRRPSAAASRSASPTATTIVDEIAVADAHPLGARPFAREDYMRKFRHRWPSPCSRADEIERFLDLAQRLPELDRRRGAAAHDRRRPRRARRSHRPRRDCSDAATSTIVDRLRSRSARLFRERLATRGELLRFPGAFNPLSARLIERKGFEGVYISGAVLRADLGLPDIGLTTLTEVAGARPADRAHDRPARRSSTPTPGFGEPMNVARTIQTLEDAGPRGARTSRTRSTRSAAATSTARPSSTRTPRSSASARRPTRAAT